MRVFTFAERPDLAERTEEVPAAFPEYMGHGEVLVEHWVKLRQQLPELQLVLWDDERDAVVGYGRTIPAREAEGLPGGVDDMVDRWFGDRPPPEPDVLSALVAVVDDRRRGEGLSGLLIEGMRDLACSERILVPDRAREADLEGPVRPHPDGGVRALETGGRAAFDPWIRLHARLGAELLEVCPASLTVEGTREEWEEWAGMRFPDDGRYVVPGALVPVEFLGGRGVYVEPNVWMRHPVDRRA